MKADLRPRLVKPEPKHRLTLADRLRGWHWRGGVKVRNHCGCEVGDIWHRGAV